MPDAPHPLPKSRFPDSLFVPCSLHSLFSAIFDAPSILIGQTIPLEQPLRQTTHSRCRIHCNRQRATLYANFTPRASCLSSRRSMVPHLLSETRDHDLPCTASFYFPASTSRRPRISRSAASHSPNRTRWTHTACRPRSPVTKVRTSLLCASCPAAFHPRRE